MSSRSRDARHLTLTTLDGLWENKAPMELPVNGEPECRLQIDPKNQAIRLVTTYSRPEPDVAQFKNVSFAAYQSGVDEFAEVTLKVEGSAHGAYSLLADVADELQLRGASLAVAVARAIVRHRDVIASRGSLTTEQEVGLFGELVFLDFLVQTIGAGPALAAWNGPTAEEHDFVFADAQIEVKSTSAERRRHVIHGLGQMVPVSGMPLTLLSVQLTVGADSVGLTLPQLVTKIRRMVGGYSTIFDGKVEAAGWVDDSADLYSQVWQLRTTPRAFLVRDDFPALTPERVAKVVPRSSLLSNVSYVIDLSDIPFDSLPAPMAAFAQSNEG